MRQFRLLLARAGLGHFSVPVVALVAVLTAVIAGVLCFRVTGLLALGMAAAVLASLALLELVRGVGNRREAAVVAALPQVVEALHSAVSAGIGLLDAFEDLARMGPAATRVVFVRVAEMSRSGTPLGNVLDWLKRELAHYQADQLCELLRFSQSSGGMSLARNLAELADQIRTDAATLGELQAKQGWVVGIAKLALATPWLVVAMLGLRPENAVLYNSGPGLALLLGGLGCCLVAFLIIQRLARLPEPKRVFAA